MKFRDFTDLQTLYQDIETCCHVLPGKVNISVVERHLKALKNVKDKKEAPNLKPTNALAKLITRNIKFLKPDVLAQLQNCEVYVVPVPFCGAYSRQNNTIVIGNGLIDLLFAYGCWSFFSEAIQEDLQQVKTSEHFPSLNVRDEITLLLFILQYRAYAYGEPMPDFGALLDDGAIRDVLTALAGGMTFILLHELGHLLLGHHDSEKSPRPITMPFVIAETLEKFQCQEFEADDFAMNAIISDFQPLHNTWVNMALGFHIQCETLLSDRGNYHPVGINRLLYANGRSDGWPSDQAYYSRHLIKMSDAHNNLEQNNDRLKQRNEEPVLLRFSKDEIEQRLSDLFTQFMPEINPAFKSLFTGKKAQWWQWG